MEKLKLTLAEWKDLIPDRASRIRVNHVADYCDGGRDSMIVERKTDGSANAHCFRCGRSGYFHPTRHFGSHRKTGEANPTSAVSSFGKTLPGDAGQEWSILDRDVKEWLLKGGVSSSNFALHGFWWSESQSKLWIEVRQYSKVTTGHKVVGYVVRGFNPKFYRTATSEASNFYGYYISPSVSSVISNTHIMIVEDVVSAIKCSQVVDSISIMGTHPCPAAIQHILTSGYRRAFVFLDGDNVTVRLKARQIAKRLPFVSTTVIEVGRDPKHLSVKEIEELLK